MPGQLDSSLFMWMSMGITHTLPPLLYVHLTRMPLNMVLGPEKKKNAAWQTKNKLERTSVAVAAANTQKILAFVGVVNYFWKGIQCIKSYFHYDKKHFLFANYFQSLEVPLTLSWRAIGMSKGFGRAVGTKFKGPVFNTSIFLKQLRITRT